jgi:hypothetical protein
LPTDSPAGRRRWRSGAVMGRLPVILLIWLIWPVSYLVWPVRRQ